MTVVPLRPAMEPLCTVCGGTCLTLEQLDVSDTGVVRRALVRCTDCGQHMVATMTTRRATTRDLGGHR